MISFRCPACGAALRMPDSHAGKRGRCPKCGRLIDVSGRIADPPPAGSGVASGDGLSGGRAQESGRLRAQQYSHVLRKENAMADLTLAAVGVLFVVVWLFLWLGVDWRWWTALLLALGGWALIGGCSLGYRASAVERSFYRSFPLGSRAFGEGLGTLHEFAKTRKSQFIDNLATKIVADCGFPADEKGGVCYPTGWLIDPRSPGDIDRGMAEYIVAHSPKEIRKWHVAPRIPQGKLSRALAAYGLKLCPRIRANDVLALFDGTVWGSARKGIILTSMATLFGRVGDRPEERPAFVSHAELKGVSRKEQVVLVFRLSGGAKLERSSEFAAELFGFFRGLILKHQTLTVESREPAASRALDLREAEQRVSLLIAERDWLAAAMLRIYECRKQARRSGGSPPCSLLALIERALSASSSRLRGAADPRTSPDAFLELRLVLPMQAVTALVVSLLPEEAEAQVRRDELTVSYEMSPDGRVRRAGKMATGMFLGAMLGGYWGAILGGDSASRSMVRKGARLRISAQQEGELVSVHIAGEPKEFAGGLGKILVAAEQRACLRVALGLDRWPPEDLQAVLRSDSSTAQKVADLLGSGAEAKQLLRPLGIAPDALMNRQRD